MDQVNIDNLTDALYCVFAALIYIGVVLTALLVGSIKGHKLNELIVEAAQRQAFEADAKGLLGKGEYSKLKELAMQRETTHPADASTQYFLGMAHLRCDEFVAAKRCFECAIKYDANWKKVCAAHLEHIAAELKKAKPSLVDNDR
ncbi:MAG TPA: hypothetical protein VMA74_06735 [Dyella sp.]|uniref:hypothetical protein n=1 Tax=Dyella sp. TaxID=1869338 RepID=UPI002CFA4384|nr:hypothetical protein [Dyella sp.]HUB89410.1 hypothetical protein [Dyella sp.]